MFTFAPGAPDERLTATPEVVPCSAVVASIGFKTSSVSWPTIDTEPVTSFLFCVPYPTTIISSRDYAVSSNDILIDC